MNYTIEETCIVHGVRHSRITFPEGTSCGMEIPMPGCNLNAVILRTRQGYLICGIGDIEVCEQLGDAAAVIYATSVETMLENPVASCTSHAKELGIQMGMCGAEALLRLL